MSSLYCLFSDFECWLWPLKAISVKVMQGKVPLFFIGLAMFKMAFFCQTSRFWDPLASGPLYQNFQPQYQYQYQKTHLGNTNTNTNTSQLVNLNTNTNTNTGKNLNTQYPIPIPQYQYLLYSSFAIEKPNRYSWTNPCWWSPLPVPFATMLLLTLQDWRCMKG